MSMMGEISEEYGCKEAEKEILEKSDYDIMCLKYGKDRVSKTFFDEEGNLISIKMSDGGYVCAPIMPDLPDGYDDIPEIEIKIDEPEIGKKFRVR